MGEFLANPYSEPQIADCSTDKEENTSIRICQALNQELGI